MTVRCLSQILALAVGSFLAGGARGILAAPGGSLGASPRSEAGSCRDSSPRLTGTIHYYCDCQSGADPACVAGNDANEPCTNISTPCKTIASAATRFRRITAGSTVALCRGGAWSEDGITLANAACGHTDNSYCDFRDYAPPWGGQATARPIWNATTNRVISFTDGSLGHRLWNIDIRRRGTADSIGIVLSGAGIGPDYIDICGIRFDLAGTVHNVRFTHINFESSGSNSALRHIILRDSEFLNSPWFALGGSFSGLVIDNNLFLNNGWSSSFGFLGHHIYLASPGSDINHDIQFTNNRVISDNRCYGVMHVNQKHLTNLSIANNYYESPSTNDNCYGIQVSSSASAGGHQNVATVRNRLIGPKTRISMSCCRNCTISDNILAGSFIDVGNEDRNCDNGGTRGTLVTNNSGYGGGIAISDIGAGHVMANNASWVEGSYCNRVSGNTKQANNYCRVTGGVPVSAVWVDAPAGDFTPSNPGPLIGTGSSTYYSHRGVGSVKWSATDTGKARRPPVDIGAFQR